ncbi:hypothetical protein D3C87_1245720 [compost metagenome]
MLGGLELLLQHDQLRLLIERRRMPESLERFIQLRAAHRQIDLGLFQCGIGIGGLLRAHAFQGCLHRIERHVNVLRPGALRPGLALGEFLLFFTTQAGVALFKPAPRVIAFGGASLLLFKTERQAADHRHYRGQRQRPHLDAIHRAGRYTEVATGAFVDDDRVHQFGCTDDGVHRARLDAFGATDALGLADVSDLRGSRTATGVQLQHRHLQQVCQGRDGFAAARRALVDRLTAGDAFGIRLAPGVPALAALGLRQECVDALNQTHVLISPLNPRKATAIRPAPIRSIGKPRKGRGTSLSAVRSRKSVNRLNTSQKPNPAPRLKAVA